MSEIFRYLPAKDHQKLMEQSELQSYPAEQTIIKEGDEHNAIYIIETGDVTVEKNSVGFPLQLATLKSGQIFGEISFLDGITASASIIAGDNGVQVYRISEEMIASLFDNNPAMSALFYKSLADILSRRLRDTNAMVSW